MKTILLTGGTGFFGKSVLDAYRRGLLAAFGIERIIAFSRHARQLRAEAPELCGSSVDLIDGDVLEMSSTFGADIVIHAAASSDARRYALDPAREARIIVEGTRRVCDVVARSTRPPRLLYLSSGAIYGRQPPGVLALSEDAPAIPDTDQGKEVYAQAKRAAEAIVRDLTAASNVPARIARCFAFVGPWLRRDQHFAIGHFLENALRGEPVEVRARHTVIRSYLHADDLAVWLARLATAEGDRCEVFNVGSGTAVSLRDLAAMVAKTGGVDIALPPEPSGAPGAEVAQIDRYIPDIDKARRELGLVVTIPLRQAIEQTLGVLSRQEKYRAWKRAGASL